MISRNDSYTYIYVCIYNIHLTLTFSLDEQEEINNEFLDAVEVNGKIRELKNKCQSLNLIISM